MRDIEHSDLKLKSYSGDLIRVLGQLPVVISFGDKLCELYIQVVDGDGPNLTGRDWMAALEVMLSMGSVHTLEQKRSVQEVHGSVFTEEPGCLQGMEVKLNVDPNATPKFFKARTVPLATKEKVEQDLTTYKRWE